jgi:hypothetical protein
MTTTYALARIAHPASDDPQQRGASAEVRRQRPITRHMCG